MCVACQNIPTILSGVGAVGLVIARLRQRHDDGSRDTDVTPPAASEQSA